jgi:hypothetical protein
MYPKVLGVHVATGGVGSCCWSDLWPRLLEHPGACHPRPKAAWQYVSQIARA